MMAPVQEIPFIDIHTHRFRDNSPGNISLFNVLYPDSLPDPSDNLIFSIGLHPWHTGSVDFDPDLLYSMASRPEVAAIGETGLDRLRGPGLEHQTRLFVTQAEIGLKLQKPVIIHCVRAWDELIAIKKRLGPGNPWIIHGFRGKPETAGLLVGEGFYLSFGEILVKNLNPVSELFRKIPMDRIFLETDESEEGIDVIYGIASEILDLTLSELKHRIAGNFKSVFGFDASSRLASTD
jgi:TatD DNase family protein